MLKRCSALAAALLLTLPAVASAGGKDKEKQKKPALTLRATPRFGFSPLGVFFTAELSGGDDVEQYYCPEIEWEWGDGDKSSKESDCAPFEAGKTKIQRRFTERHEYQWSGSYPVVVRLKRSDHTIAKADINLTVRPGASEPLRRQGYGDGGSGSDR
jgi:hypothetical protein